MKKIYGNSFVGSLPEGCKLCMRGEKLVLFVSGVCTKRCCYCPLSEKRKGIDATWANERRIKSSGEILEEARRMQARGAGVTGGDPDVRLEKTLDYVAMLKKEFGANFHVHLYTSNALSKKTIAALKSAGCDEIRFHVTASRGKAVWQAIENCVEAGIETGAEIPCVPNENERIIAIAKRLKEAGASFLNLNELEFSDTNAERLKRRGFELKSETSYAVKGSEETALEVLKACSQLGLNIHFCSSRYKDAVQLRKRLLRIAKNVAKDYEEISEDGLLLKGAVTLENPAVKKLNLLMKDLIKKFKIPRSLISVDAEKMRLETTREIAQELSRIHRHKKLRYFLVEEYPTHDRLETEVVPL